GVPRAIPEAEGTPRLLHRTPTAPAGTLRGGPRAPRGVRIADPERPAGVTRAPPGRPSRQDLPTLQPTWQKLANDPVASLARPADLHLGWSTLLSDAYFPVRRRARDSCRAGTETRTRHAVETEEDLRWRIIALTDAPRCASTVQSEELTATTRCP